MNNVFLIGRVVRTPELRETENKNKVTNMTLAITRQFKNSNGEYESDFIDCTLWKGIAEVASEYCKQGDLVAVKGRLQSMTIEKENIPKMSVMQLFVENLMFLCKKKESN